MVSLLAAVVMQARAHPKGGDFGAILGAYRKSFGYAMRGDAKGMMTLVTPDFTQTDLKGKVTTFADTQRDYEGMLKAFTHLHFTWKVTNLRIKSPAASNIVDYVMTGQTLDPKGKSHPIRVVGRESHTWRKDAGIWKQSSAKILSERVFVGGKAVKG